MVQFIIVPIFFIIAVVGMALALHFSKYKQGDSGCCGGGNCSTDGHGGNHSCYSSKSDFADDFQNIKKVKVLKIRK